MAGAESAAATAAAAARRLMWCGGRVPAAGPGEIRGGAAGFAARRSRPAQRAPLDEPSRSRAHGLPPLHHIHHEPLAVAVAVACAAGRRAARRRPGPRTARPPAAPARPLQRRACGTGRRRRGADACPARRPRRHGRAPRPAARTRLAALRTRTARPARRVLARGAARRARRPRRRHARVGRQPPVCARLCRRRVGAASRALRLGRPAARRRR
jgi:hypothetical protein